MLLAVFAGVLLALCFPPFNLSGLVWVGMLPLFVALWGDEGKKRCRRRSEASLPMRWGCKEGSAWRNPG